MLLDGKGADVLVDVNVEGLDANRMRGHGDECCNVNCCDVKLLVVRLVVGCEVPVLGASGVDLPCRG